MRKYLRLAADPNYLWTSPIAEEKLMPMVHTINEMGYLIPKFVSKTHKKLYLLLTDNELEHGKQFTQGYGFFFFIDVEKIDFSDEKNLKETTKSLVKQGLITMGSQYDWDKETIEILFEKVVF